MCDMGDQPSCGLKGEAVNVIPIPTFVTEQPTESKKKKGKDINIFLRLIQHHYTYRKPIKSEDQIQREKWLIPNIIPFNRWMTFPAAVIVQFCIGSLFSWSVFNKPIDTLIYGEDSQISTAPIAFNIACALLGISAALMGPWLEYHGPRTSCLIGTFLFCTGHFLTALALYYKQIWLVFISYGIIGGFGSGLCYISPISTLQKWFPDRRGLASGFAVSGLGAGSLIIAKVQIPLMNEFGLPLTFVVLGSIYFTAMCIGAIVLRTPPPDFSVKGMRSDRSVVVKSEKENEIDKEVMVFTISNSEKLQTKIEYHPNLTKDNATPSPMPMPINDFSSSLIEALLSTNFRLMYLMFLGSIIIFLCSISRLSNMITDIFGRSAEEASTVVAINGGFNLGGRFVFPIISDYFGRKICFQIMLTVQLVIIALFSTMTHYKAYEVFVGSVWLLTSCYGGSSGTIAAFLTDRFGPANVGPCHGVIMTGWALSGIIGGFIYTAIYDFAMSNGHKITDAFPYNVNSWWMCGVVTFGWIALLFVGPTEKDIKFRGKIKSIFCKQSN